MYAPSRSPYSQRPRVRQFDRTWQAWGSSAGHLSEVSPVILANIGSPSTSPELLVSLDPNGEGKMKQYTPASARRRPQLDNSLTDPMLSSDGSCMASVTRVDDSVERLPTFDKRSSPVFRCTLPAWTVDDEMNVIVTIAEVMENNMLKLFAKDKIGCHFLQEFYPEVGTSDREQLSNLLYGNGGDMFHSLCSDVFGNFFVQRAIERASIQEQLLIRDLLGKNVFHLCLDRYSCRVVQKAIEVLPQDFIETILEELASANIVRLSTDQNANHVIQKIMVSFPVSKWAFIVRNILLDDESLFTVAENKYGCRVLQLSIEQLCSPKNARFRFAYMLLAKLMDSIISHCERFAMNEYANYIVQHVLVAGPDECRNSIIENCLLTNILSFAQEKCASHVVEKAIAHAPPHLLHELMDEIFDGYVPHPDTHKDALDIMLFHQFGNYVVQKMLDICLEAAKGSRSTIPDFDLRMTWLQRLQERIYSNSDRLTRYSSGKKMLNTLDQISSVKVEKKFAISPNSYTVPHPYQ